MAPTLAIQPMHLCMLLRFQAHFLSRKTRTISQYIRRYSDFYGAPKLGPPEVSRILRANEHGLDVQARSLRAFETNQLPSNNPMEDRLVIARCLLTTGHLFGVFDGHGGHMLSELLSHRLFDYIALSILPPHILKQYVAKNEKTHLVKMLQVETYLESTEREIHFESLSMFAKDLLTSAGGHFSMQDALQRAFLRLDNDVSREVLENKLPDSLVYAVTGSCACVAHVDGTHLHIASTGDCKAVLGILGDDDSWRATSLSFEHNADNLSELRRVLSEHPTSEGNSVVKQDRLLGNLAPFRAFGDFNYKWKGSVIKEKLIPIFGPLVLAGNYNTPPYLTAKPEVTHHHLTPRDKFLVVASDGLWEQLQPHKVVKLVGQHTSGKQTLDLLRLPRPRIRLGDVYDILLMRQKGMEQKPIDTNAATHLIRNALGRTERGIEHSKLAAMLSLPQQVVRSFRDDISIAVIYFDSEFLRLSPAS
ncbi:pyruvate dehydrogenase [acetyl-transferring]-phosphatase 1, mitochondrial-like [Ornithodoros turicata]|uniref:pyruvate dehydrogenase [acetyl-transferring]-phosphatase 1, mitochondrial-like n=1 Tax=Ornithodoros turicata TaxID=34597 RepID=UPI003139515F